MKVYVYLYIYIYIIKYIHTYMHACMHACMHTYVHIYIYTYIHICISLSLYIYIYVYRYIDIGLVDFASACQGDRGEAPVPLMLAVWEPSRAKAVPDDVPENRKGGSQRPSSPSRLGSLLIMPKYRGSLWKGPPNTKTTMETCLRGRLNIFSHELVCQLIRKY